METRTETRKIWNFRCKECWCENPVFVDTELCFACDPVSREASDKQAKERGFDVD